MDPELVRFRDDMLQVQLARWQELPDFGLYSDQVIAILEKQLAFLDRSDGELPLTPTMINNYVKQGFIDRPVKRKYYRVHIAKLLVISLLKQVLSLTEVRKGMELQVALHGPEEAYDSFCASLENAFQTIYGNLNGREKVSFTIANIEPENLALQMASLSLASKLLTQKIILANGVRSRENRPESLDEIQIEAHKGEDNYE